jgi:alpha-tubulin suppressor-like RCC1 family protein
LGQLGDGSTTDRWTPVVSGSATSWGSISMGKDYFCGVRTSDHAVWCQGYDGNGELGQHYNSEASSPTPLLPSTSSWSGGGTGYEGGCGVKTDGTLWCWGDNSDGQVGVGVTATDYDWPVQAGVASTWRSVSVGSWTVCAVRTNDSLWCWGSTTFDQTGIAGAIGDVTVPTAGPAGSWSTVSVGETHTCAITTAGALWCWGDNGDGQLGINSVIDQETPQSVTVAGVSTWGSVSAGYYSTCAVAATGASAGKLFCWGRNTDGQVGIGNTTTPQRVPVQVGSASWSEATVGRGTVCGRQTAGSIWCWGLNDYGQLGQGGTAGTPIELTSPTQVGALTSWTHVVTGWGFSCATKTDTTVWCWGRDDDGQLGGRVGTTRTTPQQVPDFVATWLDAHTSARGVLAL